VCEAGDHGLGAGNGQRLLGNGGVDDGVDGPLAACRIAAGSMPRFTVAVVEDWKQDESSPWSSSWTVAKEASRRGGASVMV
jgi:hypothetical protein